MPNWDTRSALAAAAVIQNAIEAARRARTEDSLAEAVADALPELCQECGGYKADNSTPKWVFRDYDICECCTHDDSEHWCDMCGKPAMYENLCGSCGPVSGMRCLDCDEVYEDTKHTLMTVQERLNRLEQEIFRRIQERVGDNRMTTRTRCRICQGLKETRPPQPDGYSYCDCPDNPKYWRTAKITVQVSRNFLTDDGLNQELDGWTDITKMLKDRLDRATPYPEVKIEFEEWDGEPEQCEAT